ncbi:Multidrug efflux pump, membrane fusion (MFP/HlyD) family subunit EmrA [gamma proteobacterium HdN1]|nr:Multidrug efflux pump, membrane fusion (MFP/HlyD) family subunit EmrA [gamma proteobacterium HdN1]
MSHTAPLTTEPLATGSQRLRTRRLLMALGVLVVACGLVWSYLVSGRYVSTDNAYVKANKILLAPDVNGLVVAVQTEENQYVHAGDTLFRIDPRPYEIQLDKAKADVAGAAIKINEQKALYQQRVADRGRAQAEAEHYERELARQTNLIHNGAASEVQRDDATLNLARARQNLLMLEQEVAESLAALNNVPNIQPEQHPLYLAALAQQRKAEIDLAHTVVKAPANGYVGSPPSVGDYARAGLPLVNFVAQKPLWIEANFKETELTDVKIGQPVTITVDTYPNAVWTGKVESISPATGSEFSLLPAQNSSGNWVKVVQRIATRIAVESGPTDLALRSGMSTEVNIDTGHYPHLGDASQNALAATLP